MVTASQKKTLQEMWGKYVKNFDARKEYNRLIAQSRLINSESLQKKIDMARKVFETTQYSFITGT